MTKAHKTDFRVYYEDTDAGGIMYHGNYINFCERGRSDMLRDMGMPASKVVEDLKVGFVVRHLDANYLGMVKLDDLLTVETTLIAIKNTSFIMQQKITCDVDGQNKVVFMMDVTIVCIDMAGKPCRVPEKLREQFEEYLTKE